jgi:hypothetical protein
MKRIQAFSDRMLKPPKVPEVGVIIARDVRVRRCGGMVPDGPEKEEGDQRIKNERDQKCLPRSRERSGLRFA